MRRSRHTGLSLVEVLVILAATVALVGAALPMIQAKSCDADRATSAHNLMVLAGAHAHYALDWNERQFTLVRDDLGLFGGDCTLYNAGAGCHPPLILGNDCEDDTRGFFFCEAPGASCEHFDLVKPINFDGPFEALGAFRVPNARGFHEYVNGRFFDPVFYAPKDRPIIDEVAPLFERDCEYAAPTIDLELALSSSYVRSPAAMFHPDVFSNDGWQDPDDLPGGYASPAASQAMYPDQKTNMIEHHWLQFPYEPCNLKLEGCQPYLFNHGAKSIPQALFYDGHVHHLSVREARASDRRTLNESGYGLWSRDTPFGHDGYFTDLSYDFLADTSYHILTTDGIQGRDTLK